MVYLLFWREDHLQQEMAIAAACTRPGGNKAKALDQRGPRRRGGADGEWEKQGQHVGIKLCLRYRMWNWRQTWGFESGVWTGSGAWYGPGAGPAKGETIANGHGGNSAGHGSADHMLIGGLVARCLVLKGT